MIRPYLALMGAAALLTTQTAAAGAEEFKAELFGDQEVPIPVETDTTGEAKFDVENGGSRLDFELEVEDAEGILGAAGAHIHCAPAGMNGPIAVFLAGVLEGGLNGKLEIKGSLSDANVLETPCGTSLTELIEAMSDGDTYVNVHSITFRGGVVRGQIEPD